MNLFRLDSFLLISSFDRLPSLACHLLFALPYLFDLKRQFVDQIGIFIFTNTSCYLYLSLATLSKCRSILKLQRWAVIPEIADRISCSSLRISD